MEPKWKVGDIVKVINVDEIDEDWTREDLIPIYQSLLYKKVKIIAVEHIYITRERAYRVRDIHASGPMLTNTKDSFFKEEWLAPIEEEEIRIEYEYKRKSLLNWRKEDG